MNDDSVLGQLAVQFLMISLLAVGGANAVLPEMHRQVVEAHGWMTDAQFAQTFAIAQAVPGPNVLVVTLIGWHVAGLAGAVVATLAMCGPTCVLACVVGNVWYRFRRARWRRAIQGGLVPLTIGLVGASGFVLAEGAARSVPTGLYIAVTTAVLLFTRISPMWMLFGGGALGLLRVI